MQTCLRQSWLLCKAIPQTVQITPNSQKQGSGHFEQMRDPYQFNSGKDPHRLFMLIPMFIISMIMTQVVADFRMTSGLELNEIENLMFYYGSLDKSMFALFWSISGGLSWSEAMIPLKKHTP